MINLKSVEFEVNMIYGFTLSKNIDAKNFNSIINRQLEKRKFLIRDGWNTFYKINSGSNDLIQNIQIGKELDFTLKPKANSNKWKTANDILKGKITKYISIRKDGVGTVTFSFNFSKSNYNYNTADILSVLLLTPRTLYQVDSNEITNTEEEINIPSELIKKSSNIKNLWSNFSFPFKLLIQTLVEDLPKELPKWEPIFNGKDVSDELPSLTDIEITEELYFKSDCQIPYMFVFAKMQYDLYEKAFIDDEHNNRRNDRIIERKKYSKEISAILGRWLNEFNIKFTSLDYWQEMGQMSKGVYNTKFMNSLVFTTFSGMVTLTFYPDLTKLKEDDENKRLMKIPIGITHETILRYLEFSRLRWHNAIFLSLQIDKLIYFINRNHEDNSFLNALNFLINLEEKIAMHLENPGYTLWDASLGSNLTEFLNERIIDKVEAEITDKLNITRNLFNDKLKYKSTKEYITKIFE